MDFLASICISIALAGSSKTAKNENNGGPTPLSQPTPYPLVRPTTYRLHPERSIRNGGFKIAFPLDNDQILLIPHNSQNNPKSDKPLTFSQLKEEVEALRMLQSESGLRTPLLDGNLSEPFEVSKNILDSLGVNVETFEVKTQDGKVHVFRENDKVFGFLLKYIEGNIWTDKQLRIFFESIASQMATTELSQMFRTMLAHDLEKLINFLDEFRVPDLQFFITQEGNIVLTDPNMAWGNIERSPCKYRADFYKDLLHVVENFFVPQNIEEFFKWIDTRIHFDKSGEARKVLLPVDILLLESGKAAQKLSKDFEEKIDFAKWNHSGYNAPADWKADALKNFRVDHFIKHDGETKEIEKQHGRFTTTVKVKVLFEVNASNRKGYKFCVEE